MKNRSKSLPNNHYSKYKSQHSLGYFDFINLMKHVMHIPFKVSTNFFAKVCIPKGNDKNINYAKLVSMDNDFYSFDIAS